MFKVPFLSRTPISMGMLSDAEEARLEPLSSRSEEADPSTSDEVTVRRVGSSTSDRRSSVLVKGSSAG